MSIQEIKQIIEQSATIYPNYNPQLGYGVPNFGLAYTTLKNKEVTPNYFTIYPNPAVDEVYVTSNKTITEIEIYSLIGLRLKQVKNQSVINVKGLNTGVYLIKVKFDDKTYQTKKIIIN